MALDKFSFAYRVELNVDVASKSGEIQLPADQLDLNFVCKVGSAVRP